MIGYPDIEAPAELQPVTPCPECGCKAVEPRLARPGLRERPIYLRCQACGSERHDLEFYES